MKLIDKKQTIDILANLDGFTLYQLRVIETTIDDIDEIEEFRLKDNIATNIYDKLIEGIIDTVARALIGKGTLYLSPLEYNYAADRLKEYIENNSTEILSNIYERGNKDEDIR